MFQYLNRNKNVKYADDQEEVGTLRFQINLFLSFPKVLQVSTLLKISLVKQALSDYLVQMANIYFWF